MCFYQRGAANDDGSCEVTELLLHDGLVSCVWIRRRNLIGFCVLSCRFLSVKDLEEDEDGIGFQGKLRR